MLRKARTCVTRALPVLAVLLDSFVEPARAQMAISQAVEQQIPDGWRAPLGRFLQELGAPDVDYILADAKGAFIGGAFPDALLVRFENRELCSQDLCLTSIGIIRNDTFIPHVMLFAGKWFMRGDTMRQFLGRLVPPAVRLCASERPGERDCVTLQETAKGWIVVPPMP
jgi:hypothetical protein